MTFLLDTNVISELRKQRPHEGVLHWFAAYPETAFALPAIAIYEIQAGAEITRRQNPGKALEIERWLEALMHETALISLDGRAAREAARLMQGRSKAVIEDALIAAIARVNGLIVATRNTRDFQGLQVPLIDPFTYGKA